MAKAKKVTKVSSRKELFSKIELKYLGYYVVAGLILAAVLSFKVSFLTTLSKFYGVLWMFMIPGLAIFRTIYKNKIFKTCWEEYGYPFLISWVLHSLIIAGISLFFKTPINDLNLYGTSFIIAAGFAVYFYKK